MQAGGRWYCFSTRRGGGPIELVRELFSLGNSFEAGRKLVELGFGVGFLDGAKSRSRLARRLVFQVRGFREVEGQQARTVLGYLGRAATEDQADADGKCLAYKGFRKTLELYASGTGKV